MNAPTLQIRGAEPTSIDHQPCGVCPLDPDTMFYGTALPAVGIYVITWYDDGEQRGALGVAVLTHTPCRDCGRACYQPDFSLPRLYTKRYGPESHVTRGGLLEAHENAVVLAVQNRLPMGGESLLMRSRPDE